MAQAPASGIEKARNTIALDNVAHELLALDCRRAKRDWLVIGRDQHLLRRVQLVDSEPLQRAMEIGHVPIVAGDELGLWINYVARPYRMADNARKNLFCDCLAHALISGVTQASGSPLSLA